MSSVHDFIEEKSLLRRLRRGVRVCVAEGACNTGGLGRKTHNNNNNNNIVNKKKSQEKKNNILGVPWLDTFIDPGRHSTSV